MSYVWFWLALPIVLLVISNVFMTFAWYDHLRDTTSPLWQAIFISWGIAFFEYCFQVPANRLGAEQQYTTAQLKILQEVITLVVFCGYMVFRRGEPVQWNHGVAFLFLVGAVYFVFAFRQEGSTPAQHAAPSAAAPASLADPR